MKRILLATITAVALAPFTVTATAVPDGLPEDALARVGDQVIRFSELNTLLNSSPIVGLSIPALGTPERNQVMVALLVKTICANLFYLDAIRQGKDQDPEYRRDMKAFSDAILAGLYRSKYLVGDVEVSPEDVELFYKEQIQPGTELTDELRAGIEATIRKARFQERTANMRERLRDGTEVRVNPDNFDPAEDALRSDDDLVAEYGDAKVTWGEVKDQFNAGDTREGRIALVESQVDQALMARKSREAGLEQDPVYHARVGEYRKTRLINLHRGQMIRDMELDDREIRDFYAQNRHRIASAERRKIQMVVLETRDKAEEVKRQIDDGEITFFQAAGEHSIHPEAKRNLGDFGWVSQGSGFPELDKLTFSLELDELGGPVESPAGWHLVKVADVVEASRTDIDEPETRKATRRLYIKEKLDQYVKDLRVNEFPVMVYDDNLNRLFREEAEWIAAKTREMDANPERQQQLLDEMRRIVE